jgi:tetratricopeptide (TPR) repeat protein
MNRFDKHRRLSASTIFAALVATSLTAFGQAPASLFAAIHQPEQTPAAQAVPPTQEEVGDSMMARQRYQEAIEAYQHAPRTSASVWNKMGIAYQMMFNLQEASRCYRASLKIEPKSANVLNNLGTIYDAQKRYGAAQKMYNKALKIDPHSAIVLKNLGTNLLAHHKYQKGWEVYKAALAIDPRIFDRNAGPRVENPASAQDRGAMNFYMAKGCVRAGMNDRAIEYLRMALNEGFTSPKKIVADGEFAALLELPAFKQLLAEQTNPYR